MDELTALWYYLSTHMPDGDLVFLHSNCDPQCAARVDKLFDGYWTLQFGESGGVEVWYDSERHLLAGPARAWFWPAYPGPHIRFHAAPGRSHWHHRYAAFQGPRVARWVADGVWPTGPQPAPGPPAEYARRFDELLALIRGADRRWSQARAANLLEAFLLELAAAREATARPETAAPWLDALLSGPDGAEAVEDYAAFARAHGISLSTLRRVFRDATGVPLHAYALQRRVARARTLLGETDLPVKVIADRLGYRDVYFFTRQFRRHVGVPPAAYRRSRQT